MRALILAAALLLGACTSFGETRQPDGSWQVQAENLSRCSGLTSAQACIDNMLPELQAKAAGLCGATATLSSCKVTQRRVRAVECRVICGPGPVAALPASRPGRG